MYTCMASAELAALGLPDDAGANQQLSPATEDERSTAMVDGIARWLAAAGAVGAVRSSRRRGFESFPGDRLGNNQGLRNRLREMLGALSLSQLKERTWTIHDEGIVPGERALTPRITTAADALSGSPDVVGQTARVTTTPVRWPAFTVGPVTVEGEGVWLRPRTGTATARVIVLPDADQSPEYVAGCLSVAGGAQDHYALRLAEAGFEVLVVSLIDRQDTFAGSDAAEATVGGAAEASFSPTYTNQPHREWLHRAAFQMGRHIIGFEVQKVIAAVEAFSAAGSSASAPTSVALPIGLFGFGEGGLIAMHSAALEPRIRCTVLSGYFQGHHEMFATEPLYRNVFGFLSHFDDAEMSWLIAPNALIVEHAAVPEVASPPSVRKGRSGGAAPGAIATALDNAVAAECKRSNEGLRSLGKEGKVVLVTGADGSVVKYPLCAATLAHLKNALGATDAAAQVASSTEMILPSHQQLKQGIMQRMWRQVRNLESCIAASVAQAEQHRNATTWAPLVQQLKLADATTEENVVVAAPLIEANRERLWQVLGKIDAHRLPIAPKVRHMPEFSTKETTAFEVTLDVMDPGVFAWGILLVPNVALVAGSSRRPVVVCQHGLEGLPSHCIVEDDGSPERSRAFSSYKAFARRLAERGFVTFAPHNPYRGADSFRHLQRLANPIGLSLFSIIIEQHKTILEWLASLRFVDAKRVGFYGLSYGGKSAMRIPAILTQYSCSICSADFNDWVGKNTSTKFKGSYIFTGEWEMQDWNLGNTFNYSEMAMCIAPRPFMVERGHYDGVGLDHWVAWEFAKVRRGYTMLGAAQAAEIEWHDGPHTIHGKGTYAFLHRHLRWPEPAKL